MSNPNKPRTMLLAALVALAMGGVAVGSGSLAGSAPTGQGCEKTADKPGGPPACGKAQLGEAVVVAPHPLAAEAGATMLRMGGNAVDAAAAVQWALNVVEPPMSGVGGGAFILMYLADSGRLLAIDGRETAPAAASPTMFENAPLGSTVGHVRPSKEQLGIAVGVPGTLAAFDMALSEYGTMGLGQTLAPAIAVADEGFVVDAHLAFWIRTNYDKLRSWPASAEIYLTGATCPLAALPGASDVGCAGIPRLEGDVLRNPDLANTFRLLAQGGAEEFYTGEIAQAIVAAQSARGGIMTVEDLAGYAALERTPVSMSVHGVEVATMPLPSNAWTILQVLALLEPFEPATYGHNTVDGLDLFLQAFELAYEDRKQFFGAGKKEYSAEGVDRSVVLDCLLSPEYIDERRERIALGGAAQHRNESSCLQTLSGLNAGEAPSSEGNHFAEESHTTHFVVVDGWGNVVSVTTTIESAFGSGITVPGYGFLLNNEMTDFGSSGQAQPPRPGLRPPSSMSPTIVLDGGKPILALGSPGGSMIPQAVAQVLYNVIDHDLPLERAVAAGRVYQPDYFGDEISLAVGDFSWDRDVPPDVRLELRDRQQYAAPLEGFLTTSAGPIPIGNVQAAQWTGDAWLGVADDRYAVGAVVYVTPEEVAP